MAARFKVAKLALHAQCKLNSEFVGHIVVFYMCRLLPCLTLTESACFQTTVDREIFIVNKFSTVPYDDKNKNTNIFQHQIIRTKLHFRYAEATKIKQCENLTDEYFYERKFPDLRY